MYTVEVVALASVTPVAHKNAPVGRRDQIDASEPWVAKLERVRLVLAHETATGSLKPVHVQPPAVKINREQLSRPLRRPTPALIDQESGVRMTTTSSQGRRADTFAHLRPILGRGPMEMVRVLLDHLIHMRRRIVAKHATVVRARDEMPEVTDYRIDEESFAMG